MPIQCSTMSKIIDFILELISKIYEAFLNISYILDSDIRRDIFIGVTGLMVAIIIFIAEVISNKDYEIEKRLILSKTEIIKNMEFCIFIYFSMFISPIVKCSYDSSIEPPYIQNDLLFIVLQLFLNLLIIIFMYKTFNIFKKSVKLNTDKEYFNKELDNYINNRTIEIEKEASRESLKNIKQLKKEFENFIQSNNKLSIDLTVSELSKECYLPIYANKRGTIKNYNYKKIDSIVDNINNISIEETKDYLPQKKPIFIFVKQIGDKIEKNNILGYCLTGYKNFFKDFPNCIIYDENSMYIDDEIKLINENLFMVANDFLEPEDFDENDKLLNYFKYLYQNDLSGVRKMAIFQLEETARIVCKDKYKNNRYTIFLNKILSLSYQNDNFDEYKQVNRLTIMLYLHQLEIDGIDIKRVAYNFSNQYFKFEYFTINKNNNLRFYDELMSNLLSYICVLIKERQFDAISVIFKNILLGSNDYIGDDFDEKDILNLQFATGIIQCLVMFIDNNDNLEKTKKEIMDIINWTNRHFINTHDAWQIIINYKKHYYSDSSIYKVYRNLEFDFVDHEYQSSWVGHSVDNKLILRELLCASRKIYIFRDNINYEEISKNDKYYFTNLLEIFNSKEKTKFEKELSLNFSSGFYTEVLKSVIADAEKKEKEYNKNNTLDTKKVKNFGEIIKKTVFENNHLESFLNNLKKTERIDMKIKRVYGINQLIPRNIFFKDCEDYENFAREFGQMFESAKESEFVSKINSISEVSKDNVDDVIKSLKNLQDYVLITNYLNYYNLKSYNGHDDSIKINNKKLAIIKISQINCIYLIEKKHLPKLQYCNFDDSFSRKNIDKSLYYELNDCSKDEKLRDKIIEKSSWLSEKGDVNEQQEYLKEQCRLKLFLAFKFYKIKNSKAIKFNISDE